jgi:hypothetical protein
MCDETKAVEPKKLGVIGKRLFLTGVRDLFNGDGENVKYKSDAGITNGLPWVLEVGSR